MLVMMEVSMLAMEVAMEVTMVVLAMPQMRMTGMRFEGGAGEAPVTKRVAH
jgi:hypothetical protein